MIDVRVLLVLVLLTVTIADCRVHTGNLRLPQTLATAAASPTGGNAPVLLASVGSFVFDAMEVGAAQAAAARVAALNRSAVTGQALTATEVTSLEKALLDIPATLLGLSVSPMVFGDGHAAQFLSGRSLVRNPVWLSFF